jgi:hypothetical protein
MTEDNQDSDKPLETVSVQAAVAPKGAGMESFFQGLARHMKEGITEGELGECQRVLNAVTEKNGLGIVHIGYTNRHQYKISFQPTAEDPALRSRQKKFLVGLVEDAPSPYNPNNYPEMKKMGITLNARLIDDGGPWLNAVFMTSAQIVTSTNLLLPPEERGMIPPPAARGR